MSLGKSLNKTDQKQINGGIARGCTQDGVMCCESTSWGNLCAPGRCDRFGCIWY
ncbi:hypothetical protein [Tenacibaculum discolor]|uniref:hypothetical protein n=1 Tax=Tenacibaculum discolor TaxID=361581 RepID=UPI00142E5677|nr:hypothetical protein [Tenacibaculum discolor]